MATISGVADLEEAARPRGESCDGSPSFVRFVSNSVTASVVLMQPSVLVFRATMVEPARVNAATNAARNFEDVIQIIRTALSDASSGLTVWYPYR